MCIVIAEHRIDLLRPFASRRLHISAGKLVEMPNVAESHSSTTLEDQPEGSRMAGGHPISALVGPNGSGKTTALFERAIADPTSVALVPEVLADFFVRDSVLGECLRSDLTAKLLPGSTESRFRTLISAPRSILGQHPRDLSAGQQLALAIAVQSVALPLELLIDEPTRGLDESVRRQLIALLRAAARTCCITVATHDAEFVHQLQAEVVSLPV
jgi:energy-coupling factor transport system ATP-binding protein